MQDTQELHLSLHQQLFQLEFEQQQIGEGIIEVERRIGILDEAMSWSPVEVEAYREFPEKELSQEDNFSYGDVGEEACLELSQEHEFFNAEAELVPAEV